MIKVASGIVIGVAGGIAIRTTYNTVVGIASGISRAFCGTSYRASYRA